MQRGTTALGNLHTEQAKWNDQKDKYPGGRQADEMVGNSKEESVGKWVDWVVTV